MAVLVTELYKLYDRIFTEYDDPRVRGFFLLGSRYGVPIVIILYLLVILKLAPAYMRNKQPYNIDKFLVLYNGIQVLFNTYIFIEGIRVGVLRFNVGCAPVEYDNYSEESLYLARVIWFYFITKIIDVLDTIFFIMRKKDNQITFLHVYHHGGMIGLTWAFAKWVPGGATIYIVVVNSLVHMIMYTYYMLSAHDKEYKKNSWWKKHITQLQLLQFAILVSQHIYMFLSKSCPYSKYLLIIYIIQSGIFLGLFGDFYYKTYITEKKQTNKVSE